MTKKKMKVNRKQVGGEHYEKMSIQPIELYELFSLDAFQGPILKYVSRHRAKNGIQDLLKAIDYCDEAINYNHKPLVKFTEIVSYHSKALSIYCNQFKSSLNSDHSLKTLRKIITSLILGDWVSCKEQIKLLIYSEYDVDLDKV